MSSQVNKTELDRNKRIVVEFYETALNKKAPEDVKRLLGET